MQPPKSFKLVLLGESAVGKSRCVAGVGANVCYRSEGSPNCLVSLVLRFVKDQFDDYRESTIGGEDKRHLGVAGFSHIIPSSSRLPHADGQPG